MRTLPRNTAHAALHDYPASCDICGDVYLRSQLRLEEDGWLKCPRERGADAVELERLNHEMRPDYSLALNRDQGTMPSPPEIPSPTLAEELQLEAFGQPFTDFLEGL